MKLLIIVNCQNDFINGSLGFPKAEFIIDKIVDIIGNYDDIIFLNDVHENDYLDTFEGHALKTPHCIRGTSGQEVHDKLKKYLDRAHVIEKNTMPSYKLAEYLAENNKYDIVDICGVQSHMSVTANAIMVKSVLPNSLITVLKSCSESWDKALEAKAYNILNALQIEIK
ncbi:cysteine hydrolase [bacterium]|nr:cysteine hydrolase [bacterium]